MSNILEISPLTIYVNVSYPILDSRIGAFKNGSEFEFPISGFGRICLWDAIFVNHRALIDTLQRVAWRFSRRPPLRSWIRPRHSNIYLKRPLYLIEHAKSLIMPLSQTRLSCSLRFQSVGMACLCISFRILDRPPNPVFRRHGCRHGSRPRIVHCACRQVIFGDANRTLIPEFSVANLVHDPTAPFLSRHRAMPAKMMNFTFSILDRRDT